MKIVPIHYAISKPVKRVSEVVDEAEAMMTLMREGKFQGYYNKAYALAHCQVSETPLAFFVLAPELIRDKQFESMIIINPKILEAPLYVKLNSNVQIYTGKSADGSDAQDLNQIPNGVEYQEMCMSFPFRKPKRLNRYNKIKVQYQIPGVLGQLKTITRWLEGIPSEIFQHEYDHTLGRNIYFEGTPYEWWKLIGTTPGLISDDLKPKQEAVDTLHNQILDKNALGITTPYGISSIKDEVHRRDKITQ